MMEEGQRQEKAYTPRDPAITSMTMSRIRGKDTGIEMKMRMELRRRGITTYRCNSKYIFGHPDISFKKYRLVVFCDSEFWHGFNFERAKLKIKARTDYWIPKIERNIQRDKEVNERLAREGYTILRFWGFEINKELSRCVDEVVEALRKNGYQK